jgi:hypothetical protein
LDRILYRAHRLTLKVSLSHESIGHYDPQRIMTDWVAIPPPRLTFEDLMSNATQQCLVLPHT